jgi:hypothetical protein
MSSARRVSVACGSDDPAQEAKADPPRRRTVHVLATSPEATRSALLSAKRLSAGVDAQIKLLLPRVQSIVAPFDPSTSERAALVEAYRRLAASLDLDPIILFCVCYRIEDVVHQMIGRSAPIIIGARLRAWWPSRERRLVNRLSADGYTVVVVPLARVDSLRPRS